MIEKSIPAPKCSRYRLDFPSSALRSGGKIDGVRLRHMKEEENALVCAEGKTVLYAPSEFTIDRLFCTPNFIAITAIVQDRLYLYREDTHFRGFGGVHEVLEYDSETEGKVLYTFTEKKIMRIWNMKGYTTNARGAVCGTLHFDRMFAAYGTTLFYSEPLKPNDWKDQSTQAAGEIDFPNSSGKILHIESFREKLYLFREHGITALTAYGDTLNFQVKDVPFHCGTVIPFSVVRCGDEIYFFTRAGLYVFDGSVCKRAVNAEEDGLLLTEAVYAAEFHGKYYASVSRKDGKRIVYEYDGKENRARTIDFPSVQIAAQDSLYIIDDQNAFCSLSGKALPENGECALQMRLTLGEGKAYRHYLESVTVSGEGNFAVSIVSADGTVAASGAGGKDIRLPRALYGEEFSVKIVPDSAEFRICALSFGVRRDVCDN